MIIDDGDGQQIYCIFIQNINYCINVNYFLELQLLEDSKDTNVT